MTKNQLPTREIKNKEKLISKLEIAKKHALSQKGKCLSTEYINNKNKLEWKCQNIEHNNWFSSYSSIVSNGTWCPECSKEKSNKSTNLKKLSNNLQKAKEYALSKGGKCLTNIRINGLDKLEWKCNNTEHASWFSLYNNVVNINTWCPECDKEKRYLNNGLEIAKSHAESKGGQCLSTEYNSTLKMEWKCHNQNHSCWFAFYAQIINNSSWCPECNNEKRKLSNGLEKAIAYAENKNGKCLSTSYKNSRSKLEWKCHNHEHKSWFATYSNVIKNRSWCPECRLDNLIQTTQEFRVRKILDYLFKTSFIKTRSLSWNINNKTNHKLELDGYSKELNLAFEFQGRQHFEENIFKGTSLNIIQERDRSKKENCQNNGVKLIIIEELKDKKNCQEFFKNILIGIKNANIKIPKYNDKEIEKLYRLKPDNDQQKINYKKLKNL